MKVMDIDTFEARRLYNIWRKHSPEAARRGDYPPWHRLTAENKQLWVDAFVARADAIDAAIIQARKLDAR